MPIDLTKLKPSELIRVACKDVKQCIERGITIDMTWWVTSQYTKGDWRTNFMLKEIPCAACLAGAVLIGSCGVNSYKEFNQVAYGQDGLENVISALDYLRKGVVQEFIKMVLNIDRWDAMPNELVLNVPTVDMFEGKLSKEDIDLMLEQFDTLALFLETKGY